MQIYWIDENSKYEFNFMFTLQRKVPYRLEFTLKIFSSAFNFLKSTISSDIPNFLLSIPISSSEAVGKYVQNA